MRRSLLVLMLLIFMLSLLASPAFANNQLPCRFHGTVKIDGELAPSGTSVVATINEDTFSTETPSIYGASTYFIQITPPEGKTYDPGTEILFYIGTDLAAQKGTWETGGNKVLNLTLSTTAPTPTPTATPTSTPTPTPTPTPAPTPEPGVLDLTDKIDPISAIIEESTVVLYEGKPVSLSIGGNTEARDSQEDPLEEIRLEPQSQTPIIPDEYSLIGQAYSLIPSGAKFDPPVTLAIGYEPATIPEDVNEEDLLIGYYDTASGKWKELTSTVDTIDKVVSAEVNHFTIFAILGPLQSGPMSIWMVLIPIIVVAVVIGMSVVLLRFY